MDNQGAYGPSTTGRLSPKPIGPRPQPPPRSMRAPITFAPATSLRHTNSPTNGGALLSSDISRGTISRGTVLHKGFYDLLSMIPNTASQLGRSGWGADLSPRQTVEDIGGPRYEAIPHSSTNAFPNPSQRVLQKALPTVAVESRAVGLGSMIYGYFSTPAAVKKPRHVSKDLISPPTKFVHLVHASDAEQAEALLSRWGPDGMGKVGNPFWAEPIKNILRRQAQARKMVAMATQKSMDSATIEALNPQVGPSNLHVVNGVSAFTTTTANSTERGPPSSITNRIPKGNSRLGDTGVGKSHFAPVHEVPEPPKTAEPSTATIHIRKSMEIISIPDEPAERDIKPGSSSQLTAPISITSSRGWLNTVGGLNMLGGYHGTSMFSDLIDHPQPASSTLMSGAESNTVKLSSVNVAEQKSNEPQIIFEPSVMTLDRAASAKIFFENLYFPILRQPPSREQRRIALERDLSQMGHLSSAAKDEIRERWRRNETEYLREKRQKVSAEAFTRLKVIGHGAFGIVSLVREKSSGQLYAMKQLRKTDMLRKGQEGHVRAEREVLKAASLVPSSRGADWIVKMHYSFQDQDNLYLVLEYMGGGDLLNLLIEKDVFEEGFARFYIAEMILAIEQCHKQGFIHRDIKPDNFLFDPQGHIKLSDFGLATDLHWAHDTSYYEQQRQDLLHKHGIDLQDGESTGRGTRKMTQKDVEHLMGKSDGVDRGGIFTWREKNRRKLAYSVCGTNSYMSPEVIRGNGYTFSCDWWSLGVIIFECLYGFPPFVSNSRHVTRQMILNWKKNLQFPSSPHVSHEGTDLIKQLLCEPEDRLGSQTSSSTRRPNSIVTQARLSGFVTPQGSRMSVDGAEKIKAHPWFRGIDWTNIRHTKAPFRPNLRDPTDTRHFDDDIPAETLAPANGAPANATRDPLLRDNKHGKDVLNARKQLAFAGFTHKSPRVVTYPRIDALYQTSRGPDGVQRTPSSSTFGRSRALSL